MGIGQDEVVAGEQAGQRLAAAGAKHVICVAPEQGNVTVEARCDGASKTMTTGRVEKLYVNGADNAAMTSAIQAKLGTDKDIDYFLSQGGAAVLSTVNAVKQTNSNVKVTGFDLNPDVAKDIQAGTVEWTIDQQPYLQGYYAVDNLWLYLTNGNVGGGGQPILTGPAFVDKTNIDTVAKYADGGTR
ncbi:MAG: substrate-binding domain-containing protein [Janthinobacterium lividum]